MDFINNFYPYQFEGIKNGVYSYRFISSVNGRDIIKVVFLSPIRSKPDWFNLGFGNLEENNGDISVNDLSTENNNDFDKVLASVFACAMHFLNSNPDARVFFFGNTEHKHFIYKRKISANLEALQEIFLVYGGNAEYDVEINEISQEIIKNGKTISRVIKIKDHRTLKIKEIVSLELFNIQKSRLYDFIVISLSPILN